MGTRTADPVLDVDGAGPDVPYADASPGSAAEAASALAGSDSPSPDGSAEVGGVGPLELSPFERIVQSSPAAQAVSTGFDPIPDPPDQVGWVSNLARSSEAEPVAGEEGGLTGGMSPTLRASSFPSASAEVDVLVDGVVQNDDDQVGTSPVSVEVSGDGTGLPDDLDLAARLQVVDSSTANAAGFDRVAFTVTLPLDQVTADELVDASADAARDDSVEPTVRFSIDYSDFAGEFGAGWANRLRAVRFAPCSLDTPAAGCPGSVVVDGFVNDMESETVSFEMPLADLVAPGGDAAELVSSDGVSVVSAFALLAGGSSSSGNFETTSLNPSGSWAVGTQSGDFSWSYPIDAPAPPAGAAPGVSVSYSSGAIDGLTSDQNTQGGVLGPGWALSEGFIERQYTPCGLDGGAGADFCFAGDNATFSFAGMSDRLVRVGTETPPVANWAGTVYRLESHTGWVVKRYQRTNATTVRGGLGVDNDGEHWVAVDPSGTRYWFGYGAETGSFAPAQLTESVQTVPVVGNHSGEPCNTLSNNWCHQAYRWSLDRIEDSNGRVATFFYTQQANYYGIRGTPGWSEPYVTGALLSRIEYGQRAVLASNAHEHTHQIMFAYHYRCDNPVAGACLVTPTAATAANFPDTPVDQFCPDTYCENYAPTFFTRSMLRNIRTEIRTSTNTWIGHSQYVFGTEWVDPDGTAATSDPPRLWLDVIQQGGAQAGAGAGWVFLPAVRFFESGALANRVDYSTSTGVTRMFYYRVGKITDEYGSELRINYSLPKACPSPWPATPPSGWGGFQNNTWACFARYWTPPSGPSGFSVWHKYVVASVVQVDQVGTQGASSRIWVYQYPDVAGSDGGMAWHSDENPMVPVAQRSWGQYRGFERVRVIEGHTAETNRLATSYVFHRGMDGDINAHSGTSTPDSEVTESTLGSVTDYDRWKGRVREVIVTDFDNTTDAPGGDVYSATVTDYISFSTAGGDGLTSWQVETSRTRSRSIYSGGARYGRVDYEYDAASWHRRLTTATDWGRVDSSYVNTVGDDGRADDTCSTVDYTPRSPAGFDARWSDGLVWRTAMYPTSQYPDPGCTGTAMSDMRVFYDAQGATVTPTSASAPTTVPTAGNPTAAWTSLGTAVTTADGTFVYAAVDKTAYGANGYATSGPSWGRITSTTNARGLSTNYVYSPFDAVYAKGAETVTITNPATHSATIEYNRYGAQIRTTDANSRSSYVCYDEFGRAEKIYEPGVPGGPTCTANPSITYSYLFDYVPGNVSSPTTYNARWYIQTRQLFALDADIWNPADTGHSYLESWTLFDGFGRVAQTNRPSPIGGRVVTRTRYDSRDNPVRVSQPFRAAATAGEDWTIVGEGSVPTQTLTTYDPLGRPTRIDTLDNDTSIRYATTEYKPHAVIVNEPVATGGTATYAPTYRYFNADGNAWRVDELNNAGANRTTLYEYDLEGQLTGIVDADGNTTTMAYNTAGWRYSLDDPNAGNSATYFYPTGEVRYTVDANNHVLYNTIDVLGRTTATYTSLATPTAANRIAAYTYDTLSGVTGGIGTLLRAQAQTAGVTNVTTDTTAFDAAGRPTATQVTVAAADGPDPGDDALAAAYTTTVAYTRNGTPYRTIYPAVAGLLGAETVDVDFNLHGLPNRLGTVNNTYTESIAYDGIGRPLTTNMGPAGSQAGLVIANDYQDSDGRLGRITATTRAGATQVIQDDTYTYDPAGNPTRIVHHTKWDTETECFGYDPRQRLTTARTLNGSVACPASLGGVTSTGPAPYADTFTYDALHRMTASNGTTRNHDATTPSGCRTGTDTTKPHALATATGGGTTQTFTYNCNGALTTHTTNNGSTVDTDTYTWDQQQRLTEVTTPDGTTTNVYDTTNNRVARIDPDGTRTIYLGPTEIRWTPTNGIRIARTYGQTRRDFDGYITHYSTNHQGTIAAATSNNTGATPVRLRTTPYGTPRTLTNSTNAIDDRNYLGQPDDPSTSTVYLNNRHYNPALGAFVSVDPILTSSPASLSRYAYAYGRPTALSDESGLIPVRQIPDGQTMNVADARASMTWWASKRSGSSSNSSGCGLGCFLGSVVEAAANAVESSVGTAYDWVACRGRPGLDGCPDGYVPTHWNATAASIDTLLTNPTQLTRACQAAGAVRCTGQIIGNMIVVYATGRAVARIIPRPGAEPQIIVTTNAVDDVGLSTRGLVPAAGTRVRPAGIPDEWRVVPTNSGGGVRYYDPTNPGNSVRVMQGSPTSPYSNSQAPYVRWQRNGAPLDINGNVLPTANVPEAHIPLQDFTFLPEVFAG